jgi:oligopeptidase B
MRFLPAEATVPLAKKIPKVLQHHGVTRVDDYHWLRDDTRTDPVVLAHLAAENHYCDAMLAQTQDLQDSLYQEMLARVAEHQASVPVQRKFYQYWHTFPDTAQYPQFWRAPLTDIAQHSLILDANQRAQAHPYYQLAPLVYSEDEQYVCLAEDTCGDKVYNISVLQLADGSLLADILTETSGDIVWGNDSRHFYYVKVMPGTLQRAQVYRHHLGTAQQQDMLVYAEADPRFYTALRKSIDRSMVFILHHQTETLAVSTLDANHADSAVSTVLLREQGHRYLLEKHGADFFILTNWQAKNFQLVKVAITQAADKSCWQPVVAETADGLLEDMQVFDQHLVYLRRERGLPVYRVLSLQTGYTQVLQFNDQAFSAYFKDNVVMSSPRVRFCYDSLTVPSSIIEFDLNSAEPEIMQQDAILGGFCAANYQSEHLELTARDGAKVPVTLVYRKDQFQRGENPLYLEGYGAYGLNIDAHFRPEQLSLLDRGFVCAFAHIRGSSMLGWHWYEQGKLLHKHNTFHDFIDVTQALVNAGYAAKDKVFAVGESAGGLLIATVINQAPTLYKACAAHVPFVDLVTSMLDDSLPLTCGEYDEWGDPNQQAYFDYMLSYSPYDQVKPQAYPHLLVTAGLYDAQVPYFEPAKWVAKLRACKTDNHQLLFQIDCQAGHNGASGRFDKYRQIALEYAFFLSLLTAASG